MNKWYWAITALVWAFLPLQALAEASEGDLDKKQAIETWEGLVALCIPLLASVFIQHGWSKGRQVATMVIMAAVATCVGLYIEDGWSAFRSADPVITFIKIAGLTELTYKTLWQAVPLPQKIEAATGGDSFKSTNPYQTRDVTDPATGMTVRQTGQGLQ